VSGAYVVLTGAKRNVGDFLIVERCTELLRQLRPDRELHFMPSWKPIDPRADVLRNARAIVIAGGPGYQPGFYPTVYPLCPELAELPCPVVPLGLGWKGQGGDRYALDHYTFSEASLDALRWIAQRTPSLGCRDHLTRRVLERNGISDVSMVGCPVWYHLPSIGKEFEPPNAVTRVVFTPAQLHSLHDQSLAVAQRIADAWPDAEKICSFHRGLDASDDFIPEADVANNHTLAERADALGFDVVDVTGDASKLDFYDECTMHVGYRVHAHLHFLSRRKPSLLIEEDGRGAGASDALGVQGVPAFRPHRLGRLGRAAGRAASAYRVDKRVPARVEKMLASDVEMQFARFASLAETLDGHFARMQEFIRRLP
jgi:polysaccharide pyruvyl transferase WcaK-like protein